MEITKENQTERFSNDVKNLFLWWNIIHFLCSRFKKIKIKNKNKSLSYLLTIKCLGQPYHLQQGQVSISYIVKVNLHISPVEFIGAIHTLRFITDICGRHALSRGFVYTFVKFSGEVVDAHNAKNEPEDEADQQDVHDGGDGAQKSIHNHLRQQKHHKLTKCHEYCAIVTEALCFTAYSMIYLPQLKNEELKSEKKYICR